ncbi:hypothetical protein [Luteolibacter marinus]|uniref:hypothetical protein n=1 Tax=Luteolibacter marinus TaxID=2776705 RepID=UPI001868F1A6|nr:hypothetical protein [Luteolibacter marinus]
MTYRRLFHWILAGTTLAIGALWSWSCWGCAELRAGHPARLGSYHVGLWSGTVILELDSPESRPTEAAADAVPIVQQFFLPGLRGHDWSYRRNSSSDLSARHYTYRRTGKIGVEKTFHPIVMGHKSPPHFSAAYRVDLPLWVPWLLIVGLAFAVTRWLEQRTAEAQVREN